MPAAIPVTALGRSSLRVSRIGLGLAALGRPGYINLGHAGDLRRDYDVAAMQARAHEVLDAAWAGGVRYVDAARSYGRAEEFLATWLARRGLQADALTVGSKWGYTYTAGWHVEAEQHEVKDHSLATLDRQIAESRQVLDRHLDLYQIHSATLESGVLDNRPVLERLAQLRDGGLTIGLSLTGPRQRDTLRRAMQCEAGGRPVFAVVQATWNLLERSAGAALEEAHAAGIGVIIKEGLANGRLTERNRAPEFAESRRRLHAVAQRLGCTVDALALAGILARPWVDVVLSGAATIAQLESNLRAATVGWDRDTEEALSDIAEDSEAYWKVRGTLRWN